jgi:hypothetical protein
VLTVGTKRAGFLFDKRDNCGAAGGAPPGKKIQRALSHSKNAQIGVQLDKRRKLSTFCKSGLDPLKVLLRRGNSARCSTFLTAPTAARGWPAGANLVTAAAPGRRRNNLNTHKF